MIAVTKAKSPIASRTRNSSIKRAIRAYAGASLLTLLVLGFVTRFYKIDLSIPAGYHTDTEFYLMLIKGVVSKEWTPFSVPHTSRLGAPFGLSLHDFSDVADSNFLLFIAKAFSLVTTDVGRIFNYYGLLTYFLTVFTTVYALRQYRIAYNVAVVFGILYSFLPYHFLRTHGRVNPVLYAFVPLWILLVTWIWSRRPIFFRRQQGRYVWDWKNRKARVALGVLIAGGLMSIHYNYFFCFFALVAGLSAGIMRRSWRHVVTALLLIGIAGAVTSVNLVPYVKYRIEQGKNTVTVGRAIEDTETYGLKITPLLLPVSGHRIKFLSKIVGLYEAGKPLARTPWVTLGILGSAGLLWLIVYFLSPTGHYRSIYYKLGLLVMAAILFATVGGFSAAMTLLVTSHLRAYAQISIFLAFMAFLPLALALSRYQRYVPSWLAQAGLAAVLLFGLLDQTTPAFKYTPQEETKNEYRSDQAFIQAVERAAPPNAMIFQLPFMGFPESPDVNRMQPYDHFKGYLHSSTLSWSYGAVDGRFPGYWYEYMSRLPVEQLLYQLSIAGFSGLYIDRFGYKDKAADLEAQVTAQLQGPRLVSPNQRLSYFDLTDYGRRVLPPLEAATRERLKQEVLYPTEDVWEGEVWPIERDETENWRWCGNQARVTLINRSAYPRQQRLSMEFRPVRRELYHVVLDGPGFQDEIPLDNRPEKYERVVTIPARGQVAITLSSEGEPLVLPSDSRARVYAIYNLAIPNLETAAVPVRPPAAAEVLQQAWTEGFYGLEHNGGDQWHWCGPTGKLRLSNPSAVAQRRRLRMEFRPDRAQPYTVQMVGSDFQDRVTVHQAAQTYERTVTVPAQGTVTITFHSAAPPLAVANEVRTLVFAVYNFQLQPGPKDEPAGGIVETWGGGCYDLERNEAESWHWCGTDGEVTLENPSAVPQSRRLSMEFHADRPQPYEVQIRSTAFRQTIRVQNPADTFTRRIKIPARGRLMIHFHSAAAPLEVPTDPRTLVFAVYNFKLVEGN